MEILLANGGLDLQKEGDVIGHCRYAPTPQGAQFTSFWLAEPWRRRGYGSYLLKAALARTDGFAPGQPSLHTAPAPPSPAGAALLRKFGFAPGAGGLWVRRRTPDLTAVRWAQDMVRLYCPAPRLAVDATCGNGGDAAFLCSLAAPTGGRVLALDIQPAACAATRARLAQAGLPPALYTVVCDSHHRLLHYVSPGTADVVMFNFGWLPGADHQVFSTAQSSLPALQAALAALRPGGLLSAVLYSGKTIGSAEKQAVLAWLQALPLAQYTVLAAHFANWADTAPLPCLVWKKP